MTPQTTSQQPASASERLAFADTTALYYLVLGPRAQAQAVRELLSRDGRKAALSLFVRGELVRGYVRGLIHVHFAIGEEGDVAEGIRKYAAENSGRPRRLVNALTSAVEWLGRHDDAEDHDKTLRRLREHIARVLRLVDIEFPIRVRDDLRCEFGPMWSPPPDQPTPNDLLALHDAIERAADSPGCAQCEFRRAQIERLARDGIDLESDAAKARQAAYAGFAKQADALAAARKSKLGGPSCWHCDKLGDSIIALSCPDGAALLSGDHASHPALASELRLPLMLVPTAKQLRDQAKG